MTKVWHNLKLLISALWKKFEYIIEFTGLQSIAFILLNISLHIKQYDYFSYKFRLSKSVDFVNLFSLMFFLDQFIIDIFA